MPFRETYLEIISGQRHGLFAAFSRCLLRCLESPYHVASAARNFGFDAGWQATHRIEVPIISVGNLTTGGTGKTPVVACIVRILQQLNRHPGIVSRGYHADESGSNDEKRVLALLCPDVPHLQNPDRVAAANRIVSEYQVDTIVLDDGYQHRRIGRDLNIALIDATNPFGYDHILPRGLLRESMSGLQRADLILMTRCDQVSDNQLGAVEARIRSVAPDYRSNPVRVIFRPDNLLGIDGKTQPPRNIAGRKVMVATAIGNPRGFVETCRSMGAEVVCTEFFPDHYHYTSRDLESIRATAAQHQAVAVLTTLKDLVKLQPLQQSANINDEPPILTVEISTVFDSAESEQAMVAAIEHAVSLNSPMKD